jgi:hypothetical protein
MQSPAHDESERVAEAEPSHDLGVLFVHGIGEQKPADTLLQFAGPLCEWLERWLSPAQGKIVTGKAELERARLKSPLVSAGTPVNAVLHLRVEDAKTNQQWLLAESCWSTQVVPPDIKEFLGWLVTRGPWVMLFHWHQRAFRPSEPTWLLRLHHRLPFIGKRQPFWLTPLLLIAVFAVWFPISLLLACTWTIVSLVALIPIGKLRDAVYSRLRKIAGVVGDSYVFVHEPIQRAAAVEATLGALDWLHARSRKVAVVAHSQGTAVAHQALRHSAPVDRFITFGEGLGKLHALILAEAEHTGALVCAGLAAPLLAVAAIWFVRLQELHHGDIEYTFAPWVVLFIGAGCLGTAWQSVKQVLDALQERGKTLTLSDRHPAMKWCDFYASHDPVPNGPLSRSVHVPGVRERVVTVLRSMLSDHTSYWRSKGDFLPRVARELDAVAGSRMFPDLRSARLLRNVRRIDSGRVRVLAWIAIANVLALLLPLVFAWERLRLLGQGLRKTLPGSPLAFAADAMDKVDGVIKWVTTTVLNLQLPDPAKITDPLAVFGLMCIALYVWQRVFRVIWTWWRELALESLFDPTHLTVRKWDGAVLAAFVAVAGCIPLLFGIAWTFFPEMVAEIRIYRTLALLLGTLMAAVMALVLRGGLVDAWKHAWTAVRTRGDYDTRIIQLFVSIYLVMIVAAFLGKVIGLDSDRVVDYLPALIIAALFVIAYAKLAKRIQQSTAPRWLWATLALCPVVAGVLAAAAVVQTSVSSSDAQTWVRAGVFAAFAGFASIGVSWRLLGRYLRKSTLT